MMWYLCWNSYIKLQQILAIAGLEGPAIFCLIVICFYYEYIFQLFFRFLKGFRCDFRLNLILFLVANKQLYIRVFQSVGPSVGPLVDPSVRPLFFFNCRIQAKKWSNYHQCPCPTFPTDPFVYTNLFYYLQQIGKHTLNLLWLYDLGYSCIRYNGNLLYCKWKTLRSLLSARM